MGSFVTASIRGSTLDDVIRVPRTALRGSDQLIFVDEDSRIRIRNIRIARADADHIYITDGIEPGARIVVTALESPVNGMKVRTGDESEVDTSQLATAEELE